MTAKRPYASPRIEKRETLQAVTAAKLISAPLADS